MGGEEYGLGEGEERLPGDGEECGLGEGEERLLGDGEEYGLGEADGLPPHLLRLQIATPGDFLMQLRCALAGMSAQTTGRLCWGCPYARRSHEPTTNLLCAGIRAGWIVHITAEGCTPRKITGTVSRGSTMFLPGRPQPVATHLCPQRTVAGTPAWASTDCSRRGSETIRSRTMTVPFCPVFTDQSASVTCT